MHPVIRSHERYRNPAIPEDPDDLLFFIADSPDRPPLKEDLHLNAPFPRIKEIMRHAKGGKFIHIDKDAVFGRIHGILIDLQRAVRCSESHPVNPGKDRRCEPRLADHQHAGIPGISLKEVDLALPRLNVPRPCDFLQQSVVFVEHQLITAV